MGLVVGDDREQTPETRDDFFGSGLAHLLAVSGQNVAFVLALVEPVVRRLDPRLRLMAVAAVLVVFATITRFEPSVLRATLMAGLAVFAATIGRPVAGVRVLALTVCALLVLDPFLVHSLGFGLSVCASAGIVLLAEPIARALPGPRGPAGALGVIVGAQVGVAPLLLTAFGGIPVAALPANLLAEPVAGLVMMWGASAGLVAGVLPEPLAELVHGPTSVALWWIAAVARRMADAGLGELGPLAIAFSMVVGVAVVRLQSRHQLLRRAGAVAIVAVLASPSVAIRWMSADAQDLAGAGRLSRAGTAGVTLVVTPEATPAAALRSLRRAGITHLDRLVLPSGDSSARAVAALISRRVDVRRTVTEPSDRSTR
jgi:competence protein ComEC